MCEYKIEKILGKIEKVGFFNYDVVKTNEYNYLKKNDGWVLVGTFPTEKRNTDTVQTIELVFEKQD